MRSLQVVGFSACRFQTNAGTPDRVGVRRCCPSLFDQSGRNRRSGDHRVRGAGFNRVDVVARELPAEVPALFARLAK